MTHATALQLSMLADNALSAEESVALSAHIKTCPMCLASLAAARSEAGFISSALHKATPEAPRELAIPKFSRPVTLRGFALANLTTGLVIWLVQFLWKTLFGELLVNATTWVTSIYLPDIYAMASTTALYLLEEGTTMLDTYLSFVVVSLLVVTLLALVLRYRRSNTAVGACLLIILAGTLVVPPPAHALELMRDEDIVTIASSQTIDDTLLVAAETVIIEGVINGDLFAAGSRIEISGTVKGNLIAFGESVTVTGSVGGFVLGASDSYDIRGATVGGDLWVAGDNVKVDSESTIGRNATVATQSVSVDGTVAKDLYAFAETVNFRGDLGEDLEAFTKRVRLLGDAHVGGNVRIHSGSEEALHRDANVRVDGEVEFLDMPESLEDKNRYATIEFYLWQFAQLISAFLVGLGLLWLVPGLRNLSIGSGTESLKSAGIGFLTLASVPIMAVLVAFTLVGLPLSIIALASWLLGLYLAKIVIAIIVGHMLMSEREGLALPLLAGVTIVIVAVNLPFIGGIVSLLFTIVGLGLLVEFLLANLRTRNLDHLA